LGHVKVGESPTLARQAVKIRSRKSFAAEAADVMRPLFDAGGIRLRVTRGDIRPMPVDRARLLQVFRIVLDNALRHTPTGGEVAIQAPQSGRSAMITVTDTGPGIDPQHLAHVFERFYRVDSARSRQAGGSGLGLPIAKAIVEAHGGRISIESQPHQGTTVTIVLGTPGKTDQ